MCIHLEAVQEDNTKDVRDGDAVCVKPWVGYTRACTQQQDLVSLLLLMEIAVCRDFEGVQKDNEKAVSEMKTLAESFEKEVTEEGELEPSARCAPFSQNLVQFQDVDLRWRMDDICQADLLQQHVIYSSDKDVTGEAKLMSSARCDSVITQQHAQMWPAQSQAPL